MIKSVTIKQRGVQLLKILYRKSGEYELIRNPGMIDLDIEIRDERGRKISFVPRKDVKK